jgi:hypothetical protein
MESFAWKIAGAEIEISEGVRESACDSFVPENPI